MQGVIHFNPALKHQHDHALAFQGAGFRATSDIDTPADIHVISGPWYAYQKWHGKPDVLMIDRAWWGDPDCVSLGWLQKDGSRKYAHGRAPRPKPELREWKDTAWPALSCLVLADYGQDVDGIAAEAKRRFSQVEVRRHPADRRKGVFDGIPLTKQVTFYDCVIGTSGSALFEAIIRGIPAICLDPTNECAPVCSDAIDAPLVRPDRDQWLHEMSYKQFSLAEIADGTAWELLKNV